MFVSFINVFTRVRGFSYQVVYVIGLQRQWSWSSS